MSIRPLSPRVPARSDPLHCRPPFARTALALAVCLLAAPAASQMPGQSQVGGGAAQGQGYDTFARLQARQQWMEQELKRIAGINRGLERENEALMGDFERAVEEVSGLKQRLEQDQARIKEASQALRAKEAALIAAKGELQRLESINRDAEQARRDLTAENAKFAAALAEERTAAKAAAEAMRSEIEQLRNRLAEIEKENADLNARFADVEAIRDRALSANLTLQAEKRELESERESRGHALAELQQHLDSQQAALDAKQTDFELLQQERTKLEQELASLKQQLVGAMNARHQAEQQSAELGEKLDRIQAQLELQTHAMGEATARAERAEERVADVETAVSQLAMDKERLQAGLEERDAKLQEVEGQLAAARDTYAEAAKKAEEARSALSEEKDKLAAGLADARKRAEGLESQLAAERAERTRSEAATTDAQVKLAAERDALRADLAKARDAAADLKQRMDRTEEARAGAVAALERLQADKASVEKELQAQKQSAVELKSALEGRKGKTAEVEAELAKARDAVEAAAKALDAERKRAAALETALAEAEAQGAARGEEAEQAAARNAALTSELAELRAKLPQAAGGTLSEEQVREDATGALAALRELYQKRGEMDKAAWEAERDALQTRLGTSQSLLAGAIGARGLYRVQRDDTLAKISRNLYGRANRWPEIYEANRHLLESPDRVFPGMTLVIP